MSKEFICKHRNFRSCILNAELIGLKMCMVNNNLNINSFSLVPVLAIYIILLVALCIRKLCIMVAVL